MQTRIGDKLGDDEQHILGRSALEDLARNRVNLNKVIARWPDMLKPGPWSPTRSAPTTCCEWSTRWTTPTTRQMNRQLTVQESRHKLARDVCHGKRGTTHQAYRDGMEDQPGALGLVLNAIALWTTRYTDAAVVQLQAEGHGIRKEGIAKLSPFEHRNLNLLGRYSFTASAPAVGALRPPHDPDAPELDEDGTG